MRPTKLNSSNSRPVNIPKVINAENALVEREQLNRILAELSANSGSGTPGEDGAQGERGPVGPAGVDGADGADGTSVATDAIWDAKGDIAVATGSDTASKLVVGPVGTTLKPEPSESTGLRWERAPIDPRYEMFRSWDLQGIIVPSSTATGTSFLTTPAHTSVCYRSNTTGSGVTNLGSLDGRPGVMRFSTGTTTPGTIYSRVFLDGNANTANLRNAYTRAVAIVKASHVWSSGQAVQPGFGFVDSISGSPVNRASISCDSSTGVLSFVAYNASSLTTDESLATTWGTGWERWELEITDVAGTATVRVTINDTQVGLFTGVAIPDVSLGLGFLVTKAAGSDNRYWDCDYFDIYQRFTTPR